jgi:signal transduction histidine kinase
MKSPTPALVAGLVVTLAITGAYAAYTLHSVERMRAVQTETVERNRRASLQLLRIQSDLNSLALAMRDMLDNPDQMPLWAWEAPLERMRVNLADAVAMEATLAEGVRNPARTGYLRQSFEDFWRAAGEAMAMARAGREDGARRMVAETLQPRQEALTALTARLLVERNNEESRGGQQVAEIFGNIETTAYRFLVASVALLLLTGAGLIRANRALFAQLTDLAEQRRELARQLIATQESTFRAISRDLHDEFGQILTALGAMLKRARRQAPDTAFEAQVQESAEIVQGTLEKIRTLSQSLQPVILEEQGLLATIAWHLPVFERQTGIRVHYEPPEGRVAVASEAAIHVFRILQEGLNNVARHAGVEEVWVSIACTEGEFTMTIEDRGRGISEGSRPGLGLAAMRERAGLIGGALTVERGPRGGTRLRLQAPLDAVAEGSIA